MAEKIEQVLARLLDQWQKEHPECRAKIISAIRVRHTGWLKIRHDAVRLSDSAQAIHRQLRACRWPGRV